MDDDDDDMPGGGTLVMEPGPQGPQRHPPKIVIAGYEEPSSEDPATLMRPQGHGTMQMSPVDPLARTQPPRMGDLSPTGTKPLGIMAPHDIARALPNFGAPTGPFAPMPAVPPMQAPIEAPPATQQYPMPPQAPAPTASSPGLGASAPLPSPFASHPSLASNPSLPAPYEPTREFPDPGLAAAPDRRGGRLRFALGAMIAFLLLTIVALVIVATRPKPNAANTSASSTASAVAPPTASTTAPEIARPAPTSDASASSDLPKDGPDAVAIAALEKLRDSVAGCVRNRIHKLPGTSPTVPESLAWLKRGPYKPLPRDFISPFFACTSYKLTEPMAFMIQWQYQKPDKVGTGIAWIEADGDGVPERAYAFTGKFVGKDTVEFTPIVPVEPTKKTQRSR